jgi:hypothetical protein
MTEAIESDEPDGADDDTADQADADAVVTVDAVDQVEFTTSADDAVQNEKP